MAEKTLPQVLIAPGIMTDGELPDSHQKYYKTYREMRSDPTIALARFLSVAPLVVSGWSYEAKDWAPEGAKEFVSEQMERVRMRLLKAVFEGYIDYGWSPFEIVWGVDDDLMQVIQEFKPLLQDYTTILVDEKTGRMLGLRQDLLGTNVDLYAGEYLCIALDVEGTYWYGDPLMENVREIDKKWEVIEDAASRYDKKVAGSHWVVHYPMGTSLVDGEEIDNFIVAKKILASLQSSGAVTVPTKLKPESDDVDGENAWKIELLSDSGNARAAFVDRQKYLDALKVRAFGLPERSVLEGEFGTKAEAEAHGNFAIVNMEMRAQLVVEDINRKAVNFILTNNYGPYARDSVVIVANPIKDASLAFLRDLYKTMLTGDMGASEIATIDTDTMKERTGVPKKPDPIMTLYDDMQVGTTLPADPTSSIQGDPWSGTQPQSSPQYLPAS
jgi:hypothetical protein